MYNIKDFEIDNNRPEGKAEKRIYKKFLLVLSIMSLFVFNSPVSFAMDENPEMKKHFVKKINEYQTKKTNLRDSYIKLGDKNNNSLEAQQMQNQLMKKINKYDKKIEKLEKIIEGNKVNSNTSSEKMDNKKKASDDNPSCSIS